MRKFKTYQRHGFTISRSVPTRYNNLGSSWWEGRSDETSFIADTLRGAFRMARENKKGTEY